jgi:dTDP-6-deoxy-L-talose 4-dehydrogenase (NAD+)
MKILVTGATGFIGGHVINELLQLTDCEIIATSRNMQKAQHFLWFPRVQYIPFDLSEQCDDYYALFQCPDILIHLAWDGLPYYKDIIHIDKNLFANYRFLKNLIEKGLKNVLVTGTCLEYGLQEGCLTEDCITAPICAYGLAKDLLRKLICELQKYYSFSWQWARLFYMYGAGQSKKSLFSQLDEALMTDQKEFNMSGGEQLRDYLPVQKVAEYIVKIALQDKVFGCINCCSGRPIAIRTLVEKRITESKKELQLNLGYYPYPDYEPMAFWGCKDKLNLILE